MVVRIFPTRIGQLALQTARDLDQTRLEDMFSSAERAYHVELSNKCKEDDRVNFSKGYVKGISDILAIIDDNGYLLSKTPETFKRKLFEYVRHLESSV